MEIMEQATRQELKKIKTGSEKCNDNNDNLL